MSSQPRGVDGRSQRRIDNGERLLDAAIELLEGKSYQDLSVDDICSAAGVGRATFFRTFKSKSGLMIEYNRRLATKIRQRLEAIRPTDAVQALRIVGSLFADHFSSASPGLVNMAVDHILNRDISMQKAVSEELLEILDEIIRNGIQEGSIRSALPSKMTAYLALSHIGTAANYWFLHPERDLQQLTKESLEHWLHGAAKKASD